MILANLPLNQLQNAEFRKFMQYYAQKDVPTE